MAKKTEKAQRKHAASTADRVYTPTRTQPGYDEDPACIHFYYIGPDNGKRRDFRHYFFADRDRPIPYDEVEYHIRCLVLNASSEMEEQLPPPQVWEYSRDAHGREQNVWCRKSYLVFFVNDPNLHLAPMNAITFDPPTSTTGHSPNHSFFDAWDMSFDVGGRAQTAVGLINHMKRNAKGETLGRAKQSFYFKLNFVESPIRWPDSGGTNMGPPIPPP